MNSHGNSPLTTTDPGEAQEGSITRPLLRVPHVLTDVAEVHAAVEKLLDGPAFCFDVETLETDEAKANDAPNPRTNSLLWIGLGGHGQTYLIPMGHPKGVTIKRAHKETHRRLHPVRPRR